MPGLGFDDFVYVGLWNLVCILSLNIDGVRSRLTLHLCNEFFSAKINALFCWLLHEVDRECNPGKLK